MGNNKLRAARKAADLSQEELAERAHVAQSNISRYEQGRPPFVDDAIRIAEALGKTVEDLWGDSENPAHASPAVDRGPDFAQAPAEVV